MNLVSARSQAVEIDEAGGGELVAVADAAAGAPGDGDFQLSRALFDELLETLGLFGGGLGGAVEAAVKGDFESFALVGFGDDLRDRCFQALLIRGRFSADIESADRQGGDDVDRAAAFDVADVDGDAGTGQSAEFHRALGHQRDRIATQMRLAAGMSRPAMHDQRVIPRAAALGHEASIGQRGLKEQADVVALGRFFKQGRGSGRADFFIGIDQHFPADVVGPGALFDGLDRDQHDRQAALGVAHAGAANTICIESFHGLER